MDGHAERPDYAADVAAVGRIEAVPTILDVVCRMTGMGFASVARVTEGRWIACGVRDEIAFGLVPGGELEIETTLCREVQQRREALIISDVAENDIYCGHPTPAMYGFRSYISVPIILQDGTVFGTLCAVDPKPRMLDGPEIAGSFKMFAELIAFHLGVQFRLAETEAELAREREMAELREQFIAILGHDLRNPLASVEAGIRMLRKRPERLAELVPHMEGSIARMSVLIGDVLDLARGRLGGGLDVKAEPDVDLAPTLNQVVQELRNAHAGRVIEADFQMQDTVTCDPGRIAQLLSNLLGNALMHGAADQPVRVSGVARDGRLELSVANGGDPIPAAAREWLFLPFRRGQHRPNQEGIGLGLFIVAEIAKAHGGKVGMASSEAETRFTFSMARGRPHFDSARPKAGPGVQP